MSQIVVRPADKECGARVFRKRIAVIGGKQNDASTAMREALGFKRAGVLKGVGQKFDSWQDISLGLRALDGCGTEGPADSESGGR